jgi:hypothetical protein
MGEIVNLNKVRKQRDRDAARQTADQNRNDYGRTKAERRKTKAEIDKATKDLDGKKVD